MLSFFQSTFDFPNGHIDDTRFDPVTWEELPWQGRLWPVSWYYGTWKRSFTMVPWFCWEKKHFNTAKRCKMHLQEFETLKIQVYHVHNAVSCPILILVTFGKPQAAAVSFNWMKDIWSWWSVRILILRKTGYAWIDPFLRISKSNVLKLSLGDAHSRAFVSTTSCPILHWWLLLWGCTWHSRC